MNQIINQQFDLFLKEHKEITNQEFKKVDLEELLSPVFGNLIASLLFGYECEKDMPQIDGKSLIHAIKEIVENSIKEILDIPNNLTGGLIRKFRLRKCYKRFDELKSIVEKTIISEYQRRFDNLSSKDDLNLLQLMVNHNKKMLEIDQSRVLRDDDIIGAITTLQFAGIDTSLQTTKAGWTYLCNYQIHLHDEIKKSGVKNIEEMLNNKKLDNLINESLRLFNPLPFTVNRIILKDVTIGGINIRKGDRVCVPLATARNRDCYGNGKDFVPERFEWENERAIPKDTFMPFWNGKRSCIGKNFALIAMKLVMGNLAQRFEFESIEDFKFKMGFSGVYGCANAVVSMKLKA